MSWKLLEVISSLLLIRSLYVHIWFVFVFCRNHGGPAAQRTLEIQACVLLNSAGDGERSVPWHLPSDPRQVCGDWWSPQGHGKSCILSGDLIISFIGVFIRDAMLMIDSQTINTFTTTAPQLLWVWTWESLNWDQQGIISSFKLASVCASGDSWAVEPNSAVSSLSSQCNSWRRCQGLKFKSALLSKLLGHKLYLFLC